jgi:hypothetical protein
MLAELRCRFIDERCYEERRVIQLILYIYMAEVFRIPCNSRVITKRGYAFHEALAA